MKKKFEVSPAITISKERAEEIWKSSGFARRIEATMSPGELTYLFEVWATMPRNSKILDAFIKIKNPLNEEATSNLLVFAQNQRKAALEALEAEITSRLGSRRAEPLAELVEAISSGRTTDLVCEAIVNSLVRGVASVQFDMVNKCLCIQLNE